MEEKSIELLGMSVVPRKFWDILFFCAVRMEIETEAYGTTEERKQWLRDKIKLSEELMKRIPFEEKENQVSTKE